MYVYVVQYDLGT